MSCSGSIWSVISKINGTASFCSSFISLLPQIIETFRDKTVEGLSPYFLLAWVGGDITSLIGAILTNQLMFQVLLALYFLCNDLFVCGQYYYYGVLHENKLATTGHESKPIYADVPVEDSQSDSDTVQSDGATIGNRNTRKGFLSGIFALFGSIRNTSAMPLDDVILSLAAQKPTAPGTIPGNTNGTGSTLGATFSWLGATFYIGARIPQLWKNYQRKSTDGISPFLFATTLVGNVTYNISVLTSCAYRDSPDRKAFLLNELPFILGCTVTIFFDMIYFYQHYVLYAKDMKIRAYEREHAHHHHHHRDLDLDTDEARPLLQN
ncbi:hypothetical protein HG535_0C03910 [Zygotorulaspora mrakii]|uniref:Uncharacterized protein n=1 Tax=Zygotorulaspora mrakii TaxID=42260 RepID=A0A7H9B0N3_ZYGMR|nr:uncharacterized protein HG535_0C03910 [Zygotorulaspora mrakii]QLG72037.1 hypothetical protein HG535_0C03910 [Zygotorulaspora mrakii]